jgi:hypothetical protein
MKSRLCPYLERTMSGRLKSAQAASTSSFDTVTPPLFRMRATHWTRFLSSAPTREQPCRHSPGVGIESSPPQMRRDRVAPYGAYRVSDPFVTSAPLRRGVFFCGRRSPFANNLLARSARRDGPDNSRCHRSPGPSPIVAGASLCVPCYDPQRP